MEDGDEDLLGDEYNGLDICLSRGKEEDPSTQTPLDDALGT